MSAKKFLLDSNIFIQAHRMHYPFDIFPSFWNKLLELGNNGSILSIDKVKQELIGGQDKLCNWCQEAIDPNFFVNSSDCLDKYQEIINWANNNSQFNSNAKAEFLKADLADPWLIAYALKNDCEIVTYEVSRPESKRNIKIPEPCNHFGVKYLNLIDLFKELNVSI